MAKFFKAIGWTFLYLFLYTLVNTILGFVCAYFYDPGLLTVTNAVEIQQRLLNALSATAIYATGISSLFTIGVLMFLKPREKTIGQTYRIRWPGILNMLSVLGLGLLVYVGINAFVGLVPWPQAWMIKHDQSTGLALGGKLWTTILFAVILIPITEELLCRGAIYGALKKGMAMPIAMILQAMIFGVIHMNIIQGIYAFMLGMVLVLIYERTKSIWAPILMHVLFNGISAALSTIEAQQLESFLTQYPFAIFAVLSACVLFGILGLLGILLLNSKKRAQASEI